MERAVFRSFVDRGHERAILGVDCALIIGLESLLEPAEVSLDGRGTPAVLQALSL